MLHLGRFLAVDLTACGLLFLACLPCNGRAAVGLGERERRRRGSSTFSKDGLPSHYYNWVTTLMLRPKVYYSLCEQDMTL